MGQDTASDKPRLRSLGAGTGNPSDVSMKAPDIVVRRERSRSRSRSRDRMTNWEGENYGDVVQEREMRYREALSGGEPRERRKASEGLIAFEMEGVGEWETPTIVKTDDDKQRPWSNALLGEWKSATGNYEDRHREPASYPDQRNSGVFDSLTKAKVKGSDTSRTRPRVYCPLPGCERSFPSTVELKRHQATYHGMGTTHFHCAEVLCGYLSPRSEKVREHCHSKHGQRRGEEQLHEVPGGSCSATTCALWRSDMPLAPGQYPDIHEANPSGARRREVHDVDGDNASNSLAGYPTEAPAVFEDHADLMLQPEQTAKRGRTPAQQTSASSVAREFKDAFATSKPAHENFAQAQSDFEAYGREQASFDGRTPLTPEAPARVQEVADQATTAEAPADTAEVHRNENQDIDDSIGAAAHKRSKELFIEAGGDPGRIKSASDPRLYDAIRRGVYQAASLPIPESKPSSEDLRTQDKRAPDLPAEGTSSTEREGGENAAVNVMRESKLATDQHREQKSGLSKVMAATEDVTQARTEEEKSRLEKRLRLVTFDVAVAAERGEDWRKRSQPQ
ncbi:hypothetical protein LTR15_004121 [Elasticomyces elasticus]|nr:hypothetical protein LTR15_004121 [Elasticomyces elasticus]